LDVYPKGPDRRVTSNILLTVITIVIAGAVLRFARSVFIPLLIALFIGYMMDPVVSLLRRARIPLIVAVLVTGVIFLGAFLFFSYVLFESAQDFAASFPRYQRAFINMINDLLTRLQIAANIFGVQILDELRKIPIGSIVLSTIQSVFGFVTEFIVIFVFSLLFLFGKYGFTRKLLRSFPQKEAKRIVMVLLHIDRDLRKYIGIKSFVSILVGAGTGLTLALFHVEFAVIIGVLTFLLNFIPYLGSTIAVVVAVLIPLVQFGSWATALWILLVLLALQNIMAQLVEPNLVGAGLKLSIPVVFVSLFFWGWLWGAPGVLLAVPMTTSLKIVMEDIPMLRPFARLLERAPHRRRPPPRRGAARAAQAGPAAEPAAHSDGGEEEGSGPPPPAGA
jgi:AI-2 transport protein TqsA